MSMNIQFYIRREFLMILQRNIIWNVLWKRGKGMSDKKKRVNIRDIDRPISEYPEGTEFVHTDNAFISLPTKEKV